MNEERERTEQKRKKLVKRSVKRKPSVKVASSSATRRHKYAVIQKARRKQKKASTFALENGQEPSQEPDDLPDIDEIPLTYESSDSPPFEEEDEELPIQGESEYAMGIDFERVLEALSVIHRHAHTEAERQRTGDTLSELEGTRLMETLRSDEKRSATIDEIIRARFEELYSGEKA